MLQETGTVVELQAQQVAVILCPKSAFCLHGKALGLRQEDDQRHMRINLSETRQQVQGVAVRQAVIDNGRVGPKIRKDFFRLSATVGLAYLVAF